MKIHKYCDYGNCKNYKQTNRNLCYVHRNFNKNDESEMCYLKIFFVFFTTFYISYNLFLLEKSGYLKYILDQNKRMLVRLCENYIQ